MRLSCPTCGAEYSAPPSMIPKEGRHVQCSACHTRWFVTGEARAIPSEEQVMARLEARAPRLRAVPDPAPRSKPEPESDESDVEFVWEGPPEARPEPAADAAEPGPAEAAEPLPPDLRAPITSALPQPQTVPERPAPPPARATPRLDLTGTAGPDGARRLPKSRFGRGLLVALAIFAVAMLIYLYAAAVAAWIPAAAPALEAYSGFVDGLRDAIAFNSPAG